MKIQIDIKSAMIGLAAGVLLSLTLGAATSLPLGPVGRFRLKTTGEHHYSYVIDTVTGKVWRGVHNGNTDSDFLKPKIE